MRKLIAFLAFATAAGAADPASFQVQVTDQPGKPAMILIPGLSSSGDVWRETAQRYQDRYQCYVITLAGFAGVKPQANPSGPLLTQVRDELLAYIRERKLAKPVIVGHSLGGTVALSLAAKEPGLIGPLVIVDGLPNTGGVYPPNFDAKKMRDGIAGQSTEQYEKFIRASPMYKAMAGKPEHQELLMDWGLKSDRVTVANAMYELMTTDLRDDLARVQSRTLVLGSWIGMKEYMTRDVILQNFDAQYAKLPGHRIILCDTARHFIMYDDPGWFFSQLDQFLAARGSAGKTE